MTKQSTAFLQKNFKKAVNHLQQGDIPVANRAFLKLSRQLPQSAAIWYNLGICQQHLEIHAKAATSYRKSLSINPKQVDAWVSLGIAYKELLQIDKAQESIKHALTLAPAHARALNLLGTIQAEQNNTEAARSSFQKSLSAEPANLDTLTNLVNLEVQAGNPDTAKEIAGRVTANRPTDKNSMLLQARLLINAKSYDVAIPMVHELESSFPEDQEVMHLGITFKEAVKDYFGVIELCEKLLKKTPKDARIWKSMADARYSLGDVEKSLQYHARALTLKPHVAEYHQSIALAFAAAGDREKAELHFRKSIEIEPEHAGTYHKLTIIKKFDSLDDPDARQILKIWNRNDLPDPARILTAFALGKIYDDCGQFDEAFGIYRIGNELKSRESKIDLDVYFKHIDRIPKVLNEPPAKISLTSEDLCPIFILGMPRSGTTLIEQILSRHSLVYGCGELPCLENSIKRLEKQAHPMRVYPDDFRDLGQHELEHETGEYLSWVRHLHDIKTPYLTDKMPFNFAHVWLIKAIFPNSPIINCQRHPLDVIISNYFQLYDSDISYVYDLETLANYYVRYHRLMAHWNDIFSDIYNIVYESLVGDVENQTRSLIASAGLEWEDRCLEQATSKTAVRTASLWQVRQGIYTSSRERWRKYEKHLTGVISILAEANITDASGNWTALPELLSRANPKGISLNR